MIFIEVHLIIQYFLLFLLLLIKINQKVFWRVNMPAVHNILIWEVWIFKIQSSHLLLVAIVLVLCWWSLKFTRRIVGTGNSQYHFVIVWLPKLLKWKVLPVPAGVSKKYNPPLFFIICSHSNKYYYNYFSYNFFRTK